VSYIYHGTDRVRFITSDDGTTLHVLDSTKVLSVGVTYGVIISYDGARMYLQVEDVEVSLAQAAGIQATSNAFEIGRHSGFAAFSSDGWIDQVAYFPRILSPLEKEYMLAGRAYSEVYVAGATQLDNAKLVW
jgi:hypothetical protein